MASEVSRAVGIGFPRLRDTSPKQRANWRLIARGIRIHWEEVDEDIAITTLLRAGWVNVERSALCVASESLLIHTTHFHHFGSNVAIPSDVF